MEYSLNPYNGFTIQNGTIPIIITVPHGSSKKDSYALQLSERHARPQVMREELEIIRLAMLVREALARKWGQPSTLIARVHRSRIDFSRGKLSLGNEYAYDDPRAEPIYDAFEESLSKMIDANIRNTTYGALLDLHGCATNENDAYLGTLNGATVVYPKGSLSGRDIIGSYLRQQGWRIVPDVNEGETHFMGRPDSIIGRHNLANLKENQILNSQSIFISMQIEIARAIRLDPIRRKKFAEDLASGIYNLFHAGFSS